MDLKSLFDALYDKLLLRDLFGKVVPGFVFMICVVSGLVGLDVIGRLLREMTFPLWIFASGFAWLLGFAFQYYGELCTALRTHPPASQSRVDPLSANAPSPTEIESHDQETRETFYWKWAQFHSIAAQHEKMHAERLNVIKEACGNAAVSIVCGFPVLASGALYRGDFAWYPLAVLLCVGFAIAYSLWRMHVEHIRRYGRFVQNTIDFRLKKSAVPGGAGTVGDLRDPQA